MELRRLDLNLVASLTAVLISTAYTLEAQAPRGAGRSAWPAGAPTQ
jgi:hypothetical protein